MLASLDATPADELADDRGRRGARPVGGGRSRRRGSTKSSSRWCDRSNSRCSRSTRSGWRRPSTRSTIGIRSSNEERSDRKRWRAAGVAYVRAQLTRALDLMGIEVPATDVGARRRYGCHRNHPVPQARGLQAGGPARRRRAARSSTPSMPIEQALDRRRRPAADRRRRRDAGAVRRAAARRRSSRPSRGATSSRSALVAAARARELPIFAICRGIQVLNVACGGTLVQDIPSQIAGALTHSLPCPPQPAVLARARGVDREGLAAVAADARAPGRQPTPAT